MKSIKLGLAALAMTTVLTSSAMALQLKLVWYVDNDAQEQSLNALLAEYTKSHPDTTFEVQITPYDSMLQKFQQYAASGIMPDISLTSSMEPVIQPFLVDLAKEIGPKWIDDFVPGWAEGAKLGDKVIAAPLHVTATGVFFNTEAFKKAGIEIPSAEKGWTWDEFLPTIKKVAEKSGTRYPLVWDISASRFIVYEFQFGNHVFSDTRPVKVTLDTAAWAKTLDQFVDITKNYMPPGLWNGTSADNPKELFYGGQAVAYMSGSWQIPGLAGTEGLKWQAGPTPRGTVKSSIFGGDYVVAFNKGQHVKESVEFIKWITSPEIQAHFAKLFGLMPANLKTPPIAYDNPLAAPAVKAMQGELVDSPLYAATDQGWIEMQPVWPVIKKAVTQTVAGQLKSIQAAEMIKKAAVEALAANK